MKAVILTRESPELLPPVGQNTVCRDYCRVKSWEVVGECADISDAYGLLSDNPGSVLVCVHAIVVARTPADLGCVVEDLRSMGASLCLLEPSRLVIAPGSSPPVPRLLALADELMRRSRSEAIRVGMRNKSG